MIDKFWYGVMIWKGFFVDLVGSTNDFLWSKLLIIMLVICGIYFTFKLNFVQFRMLKEMVHAINGGKKWC
ncbi:hypothetical protein ACT7DF_19400 [Bacillus cereus]